MEVQVTPDACGLEPSLSSMPLSTLVSNCLLPIERLIPHQGIRRDQNSIIYLQEISEDCSTLVVSSLQIFGPPDLTADQGPLSIFAAQEAEAASETCAQVQANILFPTSKDTFSSPTFP